jgi:hypothetical protein
MTETPSVLILRAVLALLAIYHLGIGVLSIISLRLTARVTATLYGLSVVDDAGLRYAVRMLGLYALSLGTLLLLAVRSPGTHRDIIAVVALLQLARAACRICFRGELAEAFRLPSTRNAFNTALLIGEALVLIACFPTA